MPVSLASSLECQTPFVGILRRDRSQIEELETRSSCESDEKCDKEEQGVKWRIGLTFDKRGGRNDKTQVCQPDRTAKSRLKENGGHTSLSGMGCNAG